MSRNVVGALLAAAACAASAGLAYTPGSGTVYSDDFEGILDPDWEQGNGFGQPSPWTQKADGGDTSFYADGRGPFPSSPTKHWARHPAYPVPAETFSIAFEYRAERSGTYIFDLDLEQRAPELRKYRLHVAGDGTVSLWRSEGDAMVQMAASAAGLIPYNRKRWIRLAIESDPSGHPRVRCRVWDGGATAEPTGWDLDFLDDRDTIARVHRFELTADGDPGVETWVDDLDVFGDMSIGVDSSIKTIYLMEISHLDIGFTKPPDDIEEFAKTHLDQVLDNMDIAPDYRWTIENGWWLDRWWERSTEAEHQRMIDRLREGRIRLAAGYANMHTTKVGHEELARCLYYSTRFGREHGIPVRFWITDDVPGSTFALPELLSRAGVEFYIGGMNTSFGGKLTLPDHGHRPFWWVGPDGSRVLAWITFDSYAEAFNWGFSFFDTFDDLHEKLGKRLPEVEESGYPFPEMLLMRGFDNHYQGFKARNLVNQWNQTYQNPKFILANPDEFFDHMLATYGPDAFPSYSGDFGAAWSPSNAGAPNTQRWVREAHRDARTAEALLAAGAAIDGDPVPADDIRFMYRKMIESDEHSGAGGWPGYFTPEEMDRNNRIHLSYARDARDTAARLVDQGLDRALADLPATGDAIVAVNPLGHTRDGWVRQALPASLYDTEFRIVERGTGVEVPFQRFDATREVLFRARSVPAVGYRVYDLLPGTPSAVPDGVLDVTPAAIENDFYRIEVDPATGAITSLYDKTRGREMIDTASPYRFNELASNTKQEYDSQQPPVAEPPDSATVTVGSSGPLLGELVVDRTGTPHVRTYYRLYRGEDRVEIENVLDRDQMPYVPQSIGTRAYVVTMPFDIHDFQIRSETTTRFLDPVADSFARPSVFDWHNVEHTLAFFDATAGVLYALDNAVAHHFENLSSLASASYSTGDALLLSRLVDRSDEYEYEDGHVGPYDVEPGAPHVYHFTHHIRAADPSFDPAAASSFGFEALTPLRSRLVGRRPGNLPDDAASFFRAEPSGVRMYTVKPADDGDGVVVRLTELLGSTTTATVSSDTFEILDAESVEADEEGGTPLSVGSTGAAVPLGPFQTATVRLRVRPAWAPITLSVTRDDAAGTVHLEWTGGVAPYTLRRARDARFTTDPVTLLDEEPESSYDDPVLRDGVSYFYLVR
ncbi:MAG: hypothetical protein D6718_09510 [Acidobacteria bacterium]|nr:MAG: hypothetical protein D6718_09510 [Acidobacteriota bacterium]